MFDLTNKHKELLNNSEIDTILFKLDKEANNRFDFDLNDYIFKFNDNEYKVIFYDVVTFYELLRYLDPSTVYMNRFNGFSYEKLTGNSNFRSQHKFRLFLNDYFTEEYNWNSLKKDLLVVKLEKK